MPDTILPAVQAKESHLAALPISIDFNVLRPLLTRDKKIVEKGEIVAFGLKTVCNEAFGLIFPEQRFNRHNEEMVYASDLKDEERMHRVLDGIQRHRAKHAGAADILRALDALEYLASNYHLSREKIIASLTPRQATELEGQFRKSFGDPAQVVIIGDPETAWPSLASRLFSRAKETVRSLIPKRENPSLLRLNS